MHAALLLGDEAVAQAAIDAGIAGAFSYPGTPATEIFEHIEGHALRHDSVSAYWSANEKVAYEEALGVSYVGRRALVSMKHVGLNVASDAFINSAITGVNGGLVIAVADDPGMHSSQNEQDTRFYADFAHVPVFEPATQQQAYDMTIEAFDCSESIGLPVIVRLVTRLAHSRADVVRLPPEQRPDAAPLAPPSDPSDWVLVPVNARRRYRHLLALQPQLLEDSERSPHNQLQLAGPRGIITAGIVRNYVNEAIGETGGPSRLHIGRYPLPRSLLRRLVDHCDEILVLEDGYPYIERQLTGLLGVAGKAVRGRQDGSVPASGELTPDLVAALLGAAAPEAAVPFEAMVGRPPQLCRGCPHGDSLRALVEATSEYQRPILFSDIGCYALGVMPPYRAVHSCVDMGSSIGLASGAAQAGVHPVVCTIGDSTFAHSGMTGLLGAARHDLPMTVMIMDNSAVAMTGIQDSILGGEQLVGVVRALGVDPEHLAVIEPVPRNHDANVAIIRREVAHRGLSVIVAQRPCVHVKRKRRVDACEGRP